MKRIMRWLIPAVALCATTATIDAQQRDIKAAKGFKVELVYRVPNAMQGSWVVMTTADNGDLHENRQPFHAGGQDHGPDADDEHERCGDQHRQAPENG